jgi:hypothetical protein
MPLIRRTLMEPDDTETLGIDPDFINVTMIFIAGLTGTGQKCCQVIGKKGINKKLAIKTLRKILMEMRRACEEMQEYLPQEDTPQSQGKIH